MKLSVTQENLAKALQTVGRVASGRSELPILQNILLRTDGARLLIAATNMEIASIQYIGAKIDKPGSITIPAKLASEFIANLPSDTVLLEVIDNHLHITSGKFSSTINGIVSDEFPELPSINEESSAAVQLSADMFKKAINQTIIAVSADATRPVLTGVYWHVRDGLIYLVATDGYRLSERILMKCEHESIDVVIPSSTLQEVMRCLDANIESLEMFFDDTQVGFRMNEQEIVSRLIDGKFPDYRQLIPATSDTVVAIKKADFSRITKIASLFARESGGGITLTADAENASLSIHSIASELGENTSEASADVSASGAITLNSRYVTEALHAIDGEDILFSFSGKISPCVIKENTKEPSVQHIIMPLKR